MTDSTFLSPIGHEETRQRFAAAIGAGRFPQSLLLYGARGVGKQRLAIWAAATLECPDAESGPCGECRSCRLAGRLEHPDIHWFFPLPRPKRASSPRKLQEKLEEQRADLLEARRTDPCYAGASDGPTGIYLGAVQVMRSLATSAPAMGPRKVLIIGRAEALVSQTGSLEAANALLKLLEEPPADTTVILTSDVPGALLPTIRSRVQAVRVPPVSREDVERFLRSTLDLDPTTARALAARSGGSIGRALELQDQDHDALQNDAVTLIRAGLDGRPHPRFDAAHSYRAFGARGDFSRTLGEARDLLRDLLARSAGAADAAFNPEALDSLFGDQQPQPEQLVCALEAVEDALHLAGRNVNPQLIVTELLRRMTRGDGPDRRPSRRARSHG